MITYYQDKITTIFEKNFSNVHLSRKKCTFSLVMNMIDKRSVHFIELAQKFNESAKVDSNLRRIQSFFSDYKMDYNAFGHFWLSLHEGTKLTICIDRSNWKFGEKNINLFFLTIYDKGVGFPIFFDLLDKRGNSNQDERIDLLEKFIACFGKERIGKIIGDREFIGGKWLYWLQKQGIPFVIRIPKHHLITLIDGTIMTSEELLANKKQHFEKNVWVNNILTNIAVRKLKDEYLIVIGDFTKDALFQFYKQRWSIETFFQSIKKRGFNVEQTHLKDENKLKKLFTLINTAYIFCLKIGTWSHNKRKAIKMKNHGYKANSFFRHGLDIWRNVITYVHNKQRQLSTLFDILEEIITKNNQNLIV